jgi:hypothetical protein
VVVRPDEVDDVSGLIDVLDSAPPLTH